VFVRFIYQFDIAFANTFGLGCVWLQLKLWLAGWLAGVRAFAHFESYHFIRAMCITDN